MFLKKGEIGNEGVFNGLQETVSFNMHMDKGNIPDSLKPKGFTGTARFNRTLYRANPLHHFQNAQAEDNQMCSSCLVSGFNDNANGNYLANANTYRSIQAVRSFRTNVYGQMALALFKVTIEENGTLFVFNKASGVFVKSQAKVILHSSNANGIFNIENNSVLFEATSAKHFRVLIAHSSGENFHLKFAIVTQNNGIQCYPQQGILQNQSGLYQIPQEFDNDTVLMLGIVSSTDQSVVDFEIFRNGNVNGNESYTGSVTLYKPSNRITISTQMTAQVHDHHPAPAHIGIFVLPC